MYKGKMDMIENKESEIRLIDANALIRTACEKFYTTNYYSHILEMIDDAPTIEPKQGHWIEVENPHNSKKPYKRCSVCGATYFELMPDFYCSKCGAKMKGVKDNEID